MGTVTCKGWIWKMIPTSGRDAIDFQSASELLREHLRNAYDDPRVLADDHMDHGLHHCERVWKCCEHILDLFADELKAAVPCILDSDARLAIFTAALTHDSSYLASAQDVSMLSSDWKHAVDTVQGVGRHYLIRYAARHHQAELAVIWLKRLFAIEQFSRLYSSDLQILILHMVRDYASHGGKKDACKDAEIPHLRPGKYSDLLRPLSVILEIADWSDSTKVRTPDARMSLEREALNRALANPNTELRVDGGSAMALKKMSLARYVDAIDLGRAPQGELVVDIRTSLPSEVNRITRNLFLKRWNIKLMPRLGLSNAYDRLFEVLHISTRTTQSHSLLTGAAIDQPHEYVISTFVAEELFQFEESLYEIRLDPRPLMEWLQERFSVSTTSVEHRDTGHRRRILSATKPRLPHIVPLAAFAAILRDMPIEFAELFYRDLFIVIMSNPVPEGRTLGSLLRDACLRSAQQIQCNGASAGLDASMRVLLLDLVTMLKNLPSSTTPSRELLSDHVRHLGATQEIASAAIELSLRFEIIDPQTFTVLDTEWVYAATFFQVSKQLDLLASPLRGV